MKRNILLIVDDVEINRIILRGLFEDAFNVMEASNGEQALQMLEQYRDRIAAMLLDIVMPGKDGYSVMEEMQERGYRDTIPVIVVTSADSSDDQVRVFDLGAWDLVTKPFEPRAVSRRVHNIVELNQHRQNLEELVQTQAARLQETTDVLVGALSSIIEYRSVESGQHVLRIRMFTKVLLEDMMKNCPDCDLDPYTIAMITSAAALHDIGKIAIPDEILNKPGRLTQEEFAIMKTHAEKGGEILAKLDRFHDRMYLQYALNICLYHHERWDGGGYPKGLKGSEIPLCAQAVGVADVYDALTTDRVYKPAYPPEQAARMILNGECGLFSPWILESFQHVYETFAALTKDYADGLSPQTDVVESQFKWLKGSGGSPTAMELAQLKYYTLLRGQDSTVVEVDLDTGVYHMAYKQNSDFDRLRPDGLIQDDYREFMRHCVHPDDQMNADATAYFDEFLHSGLMKKSRRYRVFHRATGDYVWYEITMLRIHGETPGIRRLLLVWKQQTASIAAADQTFGQNPILRNSLIGIMQCRNDAGFTVEAINDGFVCLTGYSREDLKKTFQNQYLSLIVPADRANLGEDVHRRLSQDNAMEMEYRLQTKDGRVLWILDKSQVCTGPDGAETINSVLIDITNTKQAQEELRLSIERHQIIMEQTNDIIFEWDIRKNQLFYSSNWEKTFGYPPITEKISLQIPENSHIFSEDMPAFLSLMSKISAGAPYGETELRIANEDGEYLWNRIRATTQFDDRGQAIKAVGVIMDIHGEKQKTQALMEKADHDALTHLYNKGASRRRIEQRLVQAKNNGETFGALLILDLDNFKGINDTRGHMFGDAVLVEVAGQLKWLFHPGDILSRIGGDEFLIYVDRIPDQAYLCSLAAQLVACVHQVLREELADAPLSCSVGIACFPQDGETFQGLFQCCDQALYRAKALGKNRFALYDRATMEQGFGLEFQQPQRVNTQIESNQADDGETVTLVQQVFRLLYQMEDVDETIQQILELVGQRYDVSRVCVFEEMENSYCNTLGWCAEGIFPMSKEVWTFPSEGFRACQDIFDENGIFYCADTSTLPEAGRTFLQRQGICSLLLCAMYDGGVCTGFVGFNDCVQKRMWTKEQISTLRFVSEIVSAFLLKRRTQRQTAQTDENLRTLLDAQSAWIYVIDPDTHVLQYMNAQAYQLVPGAAVGMRCYEAFFCRKTPCETCPARDIRRQKNHTIKVYNPVPSAWTLMEASIITWGERPACLLVCRDVAQYQTTRPDGPPALAKSENIF